MYVCERVHVCVAICMHGTTDVDAMMEKNKVYVNEDREMRQKKKDAMVSYFLSFILFWACEVFANFFLNARAWI